MPLAAVTLPASSASVGRARSFLVQTLREWSATALEWEAAQVLSELATNAVIHAATTFTVRLELTGDVALAAELRLEVRDGSRRVPRARHYGLSATTGRGLALVGALTRSWGVEPDADGKTVWCLLPREEPDADAEPDLDAFLVLDDLEELAPRGRTA